MTRFAACTLSFFVCAGLMGCGDDKGTVQGTVTFDGQPVADGTVTFVKSEGGVAREGAVIKDGSFQARVPPGKYKIEVNAQKIVSKKKQLGFDRKEEEVNVTEELFPERYNTKTELSEEIKPGPNTVKLDLKSIK
jgi:hypothetical protein